MADVKLAIIYYSSYGHNYRMAKRAAEAAGAAGAEVRLRRVRETAPDEAVESQDAWKEHLEATSDVPVAEPDDLVWANAFLFSSPTRYGNASSQMRAFIDTLGPLWQKGELADKPVSAMTSAMNTHGGQETTLQTMYYTFMHWGSILVPPGYTDESIGESGGNPYGVSVTAGGEGVTDEKLAAIDHQTTRLVEMAEKLA
ncbi:MAG: NAD(P)H:quinone oxidoreductase type IV [Persicimonas sp.]